MAWANTRGVLGRLPPPAWGHLTLPLAGGLSPPVCELRSPPIPMLVYVGGATDDHETKAENVREDSGMVIAIPSDASERPRPRRSEAASRLVAYLPRHAVRPWGWTKARPGS